MSCFQNSEESWSILPLMHVIFCYCLHAMSEWASLYICKCSLPQLRGWRDSVNAANGKQKMILHRWIFTGGCSFISFQIYSVSQRLAFETGCRRLKVNDKCEACQFWTNTENFHINPLSGRRQKRLMIPETNLILFWLIALSKSQISSQLGLQ